MTAAKPAVLVGLAVAEDVMDMIRRSCTIISLDAKNASTTELDSVLSKVSGALIPVTVAIPNVYYDRYPGLRVLSNVAVGYDNIDVDYATTKGVLVCNTPGVLDRAVTEIVVALIINLARGVYQSEKYVRAGHWSEGRPLTLGVDVGNKTLGIVGLGRIGKMVASTARALAMTVIYYDTTRSIDLERAGLIAFRARDEVFAESDFVTVHCLLTPTTRRSIGQHEFRLMKPTAYFINTSRGAVVRQDELVSALISGEIAGAGLDVMEDEPLRADNPLCGAPNTLLLSHIGSATVETRKAMFELAARNLVAAVTGGIPETMVNPEVLGRLK